MDMNSEAENLFGFLESIGLQRYYDVIRNELKIETVQQLKQVQEQELEDIRMKKEDIHKLKKNMKKEQSQSAFGKLKKRLSRSTSDNQALRNSRSSAATMSAEPLTPPPVVGRRIIPRDQISVQSDIGQGEFGVVKHAIFSNDSGQKVEVAAKSLSQSRLEHGLNDFLKEASSMQSISHPNIVTFYGLVFQEEKEIMIITEYAPLRSLLECLHNESLHVVLTVSKLSTFATQIATGMTYLETQGLIHRDLAARNILVFSHNKVKIGDFGLSRALGLDKEYYQTKYRADLKIPIAWCAPECMNLLRFSTASDVWSFGVIMWEMFTYGKKPWDRFSSLEIYTAINAPKSERLPRPKLCPTGHYELMLKCWAHEPEQRPKFGDILIQLKTIQPTVMKAIKNSDAGSCTMDYKENENITVIDKKPVDAPSWQFWFGVMDDGRSGLFTPTDCVPLSGDASPAVQLKSKTPPKTHNSSIGNFIKTMKKTTQSSQSPPKGRKRVTRDMISAPQCDFKHTGHIGYDGVTFGNIGDIKSVIGSEPIEKVLTGKGANGDVGHTNGNAATDTLGSSHSQNNGQSNGLNWSNDATDSQPPVTDIDELGDFEFPDLSLSESLGDFGTSFIDDMIKGFSEKYTNSNVNNNSKKSSAEQLNGSRHSPTHASSSSTTGASYAPDQSQGDATSAAQLQSSLTHNADTNKQQKSSKSKPPKLVLPGSNLKEMSASDQKMIDDVIQMVNQMAQSTLTTPRSPEEKPETPGRSKLKFSFKMSKKSPKNEKKTFTEQLEDQAEKPLVSPEAEEAYNVLVAKKPVSNRHRNPSNEDRRIASRRSQIRPPPHQPPEPPTPTHTVPQLTSTHPPPHAPHRNSTIERPKDRPPLPPVACGVLHSFTNVHDLSDIPTTPPPPIPSGATKSVGTGIHTKLPQGHRQAAEPVYDNMDVIRTYDSNTEPSTLKSFFTGRYKSSSDNVSYEDLLEFSDERRAVRQIQNYLGFQVSDASCMMALEKCQNNSQNAVKFLKLKQLHGLRLCSIELCKKALLQCNWDVKVAADYILNNRNNVELVGV